MTEEAELKLAIKLAWFAVNSNPSLKLLSDDINGVLFSNKDYGLIGWVVKYYEPYDEATRKYADRKAVGFVIGQQPDLRLFKGFQTGLLYIAENFEELADHFEEGAELPKPKICMIWY